MQLIASGERLFNWIQFRYKRYRTDNTWIERMQDEFRMQSLDDLIYKSTCLMVLRRLIWNGHWYIDRFEKTKDGQIAAEKEYESSYLRQHLGFNRLEAKDLRKLVFDAVHASNSKISKTDDRSLYEKAQSNNQRCKLCGRDIDYFAQRGIADLSFTLDHVWPNSLGGESLIWNLQESHKECNDRRKNMVDESDAHYEHFHVKTSWDPNSDSDSFWKELNWSFRFAALFQSDFQCSECQDDPPIKVDQFDGDVIYSVIDRAENYNIFNVRITCERHQKLLEILEGTSRGVSL